MHRLQQRERRVGSGSDLKIGYVGGGSQGWAHTLINDLGQSADISGTVALYDLDHEAAKRNAELGNWVLDREGATGDWEFTATETLDGALEDADFVVCSTQDEPAETFAHDIDIPKEHGVYQTVADTVGPGGAMRSLRSVPQYREIAATVREQCPDAWVFNYTNPMSVCTRTLYEEYPDINAIGLCHEVFGSQRFLADVAEKHVEEAEDLTRDDIDVTVKGVNHFTWIDEAFWNGHDVFQYLEAELEERRPLDDFEPGDLDDESYYTNHHRIALDLYDRFGLLGAAGDRHLAEFVPWYLDIDAPKAIQRWGVRLTPSEERVGDGEGPARFNDYRSGEREWEFYESGEEILELMRALLGIEPMKTHLNYPNVGQTPDLPDGAIVETNAMVTGKGVSPITAGRLPGQIRSMVTRTIENQETYVEAGFAGDLDLAFQAFLNEPLVSVDRETAREMFAELVEIEREYFETYDLDDASVLE